MRFMQLEMLLSLTLVISLLVPILLAVAFMTLIERKVLASLQGRVGPNTVGIYGSLQAFADALKLLLKESVVPQHALKSIFVLSAITTLISSLFGWAVIPFGHGITLFDTQLGPLYTLAVSSVGVLGVLFSGWSANSKFAFLGSLRSTAQMISYELILGSCVFVVVLLGASLDYTTILENQQSVWYIVPLFPLFFIYFISVLAETNRTPFDLPESESELVAGYFTEHSAMPFVFFFLAEYSSIIIMSALSAIFFLGGSNLPSFLETVLLNGVMDSGPSSNDTVDTIETTATLAECGHGLWIDSIQATLLAVKTSLVCFLFVWIRATLPRVRYDQLMTLCWTDLLPWVIALIVLVPSILLSFDSL